MFARIDQTAFSGDIRIHGSLTPRMSLQFYGQPLISSGDYSDVRELARGRSLDFLRQGQGTGTWTYDPVTGVFDPDGPAGTTTVDYPRDFNDKSLRGNAVFRWEYMPGAALYLVWTQSRSIRDPNGSFDFGPSMRRLGKIDADNIFLVKATYYLNK